MYIKQLLLFLFAHKRLQAVLSHSSVPLCNMSWHSLLIDLIVRQSLARPELPYISTSHAAYLQLSCMHGAATSLEGDVALWLRLSAQLAQLKEPQLLSLLIQVVSLSLPQLLRLC